MKKIALIMALLGFGLIFVQQQSFADKKMSHQEYAKSSIKDCNECHKGEGVAPNHGADFNREHKALASRAGNNCSQCHSQAWCLDCHKGGGSGDDLTKGNAGRDYKPKTHRSDWIGMHGQKLQDNQQQCYRCHDQRYCSDCHGKLPQKFNGPPGFKSHNTNATSNSSKWGSDHASEARRNLQACQTCHENASTCKQCHSATTGGVRPHPRNFQAGNFNDRSKGKVCLQCHLPGTF